VKKDFVNQRCNKYLSILCTAVNKQLQLVTLVYSLMLCSMFSNKIQSITVDRFIVNM